MPLSARYQLTATLSPLLHGVAQYAGFDAVVLVGVALPTEGNRNYEAGVVSFGKTVGARPKDILEWDREAFKTRVISHVAEFAQRTKRKRIYAHRSVRTLMTRWLADASTSDANPGSMIHITESPGSGDGEDDEDDYEHTAVTEENAKRNKPAKQAKGQSQPRRPANPAPTTRPSTTVTQTSTATPTGQHSQQTSQPGAGASVPPRPKPTPRPRVVLPEKAGPELRAELEKMDYDIRLKEVERLNAIDDDGDWWSVNMAAKTREIERRNPVVRNLNIAHKARMGRSDSGANAPPDIRSSLTTTSTSNQAAGSSAQVQSLPPSASVHSDGTDRVGLPPVSSAPPSENPTPARTADERDPSPPFADRNDSVRPPPPGVPSGLASASPDALSTPNDLPHGPSAPPMAAPPRPDVTMDIDGPATTLARPHESDRSSATGASLGQRTSATSVITEDRLSAEGPQGPPPPPAISDGSASADANVRPAISHPHLSNEVSATTAAPGNILDTHGAPQIAGANADPAADGDVNLDDVPSSNKWLRSVHAYLDGVAVPEECVASWKAMLRTWIELERALGFNSTVRAIAALVQSKSDSF